MILRVKRFIARVIRGVLLRVVRRPAREAGGDRRLIIVLWTAWNMGGTIRAAFNLAEYMQARGWDVEIISGYRDRDEPFFGSFPAGVPVHDLDDRRKGGGPRRGPQAAAQAAERPHALRRPRGDELQRVDRPAARPPAARPGRDPRRHAPGREPDARPPARAGPADDRARADEPDKHNGALRKSMRKLYPQLDAFVVLTEQDREHYGRVLKG